MKYPIKELLGFNVLANTITSKRKNWD